MIPQGLISIIALGLTTALNGQNIDFQFYQGINKPLISFQGNKQTIKYQTNFGNDTRIGIRFGDSSKLSFSTLLGASTVQAIYTSNDATSSFSHSSIYLDIPIRYAFTILPISSVAIGPSFGFMATSSQTTNGLPVRSRSIFNKTNFSFIIEVAFKGYSADKLNLQPYLCYRTMLNSADKDGDKLHINGYSFGIKLDFKK